jgi:Cu/Ag efflux protein CusF
MNSKSRSILATTLVAAASASALTASAAPVASIDGMTSVQVTGNVRSVDVNTRAVTIVDAQGGTEVFKVGSNIPDLDKLKAGTKVTGNVQRPVHLIVLDASAPLPTQAQAGNRIVASVTGVDSQHGLIRVKDAKGSELLVQASAPATLPALTSGTRVLVDLPNPTR